MSELLLLNPQDLNLEGFNNKKNSMRCLLSLKTDFWFLLSHTEDYSNSLCLYCGCHYLCGLFQVQPGLTDNPLSVVQLRLELAVFSGDLLKQLTHTHTQVNNRQIKQIMWPQYQSCLLTFLKSLVSDSPLWVGSLQDLSDLHGQGEQRSEILLPQRLCWQNEETEQIKEVKSLIYTWNLSVGLTVNREDKQVIASVLDYSA